MARSDQISGERRRRNSESMAGRRQRMSVDLSKLDRENYVYRWVNDDGARIQALTTQDDWDIVQDRDGTIKPEATGLGASVSVVVGKGDNAPLRAVLLRKRKDYYNDDAAEKTRAIDEKEAGLKFGAVPGAGAGEFYSSSGITVENGARRRG